MTAVVTARALEVGYGGKAILPPATFRIEREELWALVGRNGGGKTTLLRTLLGLLPKVAGHVSTAPGTKIGYVPQRSELDLSVPMRVCDVVAEGLDGGWSFLVPGLPRRGRDRVRQVLAETGMAHLLEQPFAALSDGQRQRVLVSRALVSDPVLLILDEPTNGMDIAAERAAFDLFAQLKSARQLALVIVSHHMAVLGSRASHVLWVDKDQGLLRAGEIAGVCREPEFVARYGAALLGAPVTP